MFDSFYAVFFLDSFFFFFSSRRRHTRSLCDWSSDVCSSDLHVLDPRTGRPVRVMAQVTVLARSAAVAEAASTALLVLGRSSVATLAARLNLDACWVDRAGVSTTPRFPLHRLD